MIDYDQATNAMIVDLCRDAKELMRCFTRILCYLESKNEQS